MSHLKRFVRRFLPNPFDRQMQKCVKNGGKRFLVVWNRGLGDIPLGLYALKERLLHFIPDAKLDFLTRPDLRECFEMLGDVGVRTSDKIVRGKEVDLTEHDTSEYDLVLDRVDPTYWFAWQIGSLIPKLQPPTPHLARRFSLSGKDWVGVHVSSETGQFYGYEKNWPVEKWRELFAKSDRHFLLFGLKADEAFDLPNVVDLRGETTLSEMLAIIQAHCRVVLAPDSGILSVLYYVDSQFPLQVISLWADPRQGVLRQNVPSPNQLLKHFPLISEKDLSKITTKQVLSVMQQWKN